MKAEIRLEPLRVVRGKGLVPGVLFGKDIEPISLQVDEKELTQAVREFGFSKTFKMKVQKTTHTVLLKDVQRDVMNPYHILNVKLQKVSKGDTLSANVSLNILGKEAIEKARLVLHIVADSVEVEYGVGKGVSHIDIDVSELKENDTVHVSDLEIPEGLKVIDDLDKLLISVAEPAKYEEPEEDEVEVVEEAADPTKVEAIKQKIDNN